MKMQKVYVLLMTAIIAKATFSQEFTQVFTGSIVNDGGWNYACCWADFNNDGFDDLFVCNNDANNGKLNFLYYNNGDGTFTKDNSGGPVTTDGGSSYGCCAADYDNDGHIDLFVSNYNENNFLYRNTGSGFEKITDDPVVTSGGKSTGCEWIDYDRDRFLDLFVCNRDQSNYLFHNEGDGSFVRVYTGTLTSEVKNTGACAWGDVDLNGFPDVFLANSGPDYNTLYFNNGDGTFTQITGDPVVSDLENFDIACCGDIDNDGDPDIYTAPGMLPGSSYDVYLYRNQGDGTFVRVTGVPHAGINSGGGCSMADWDNDGDQDIFQTAYDGDNLVLLNDGSGSFSQITAGVLASDGNYNKEPSWTDMDHDGDVDLFIAVNNYFGGNNKLFSNNGNSNHWIDITCEGTVSNRNGIGAILTVIAELSGQTIIQTLMVDDLNSLTSHVGLGDATLIGEIDVEWPSGILTTLTDVAVDQRILIPESCVAIPEKEEGGTGLRLSNFPNPFSGSTTILFSLPSAVSRSLPGMSPSQNLQEEITLEFRALQGTIVRRFLVHEGEDSLVWDGNDRSGNPAAPGIYLCTLSIDGACASSGKCLKN